MKSIKGRVINEGSAKGEAIVMNMPFSFILNFDPYSGHLKGGYSTAGESLTGKILVCPGGKGGTVDPYIAYEGKKRGTAPLAILCQIAEPIIALSAITIDIPMIDNLDADIVNEINTGDYIEIDGETGTVTIS